MRSRAARALAVGLALAFLGSAAMALERQVPAGTIVLVVRGTAPLPPGSDLPTASKPIPGVDIIVRKKCNPVRPGCPGSIAVTKTDLLDGTYQVTGLNAGEEYDLSLAGQHVKTITVGANRSISGVLNKNSDGSASIVVSGKGVSPGIWDDTDIVHGIKIVEIIGNQSPEELPGAPINTTRSNIKRPGAAVTPPVDVLPRAVTIGQPFVPGGGTPGVVIGQPFVLGGGTPDIAIKEAGAKDPEQQGFKIAENESPRPTTRGTAPTGGDGKAGISDQAAAGGLTSYSAAPRPDGPVDNKPLGRLELLIKIAHEGGGGAGAPAGRWVSTTTADANGAFKFDKLPPGKYKLTVADQAPRSVTVGADGTAGGSVMRGSDGDMKIFDRWGKLLAVSPAGEARQSKTAAEKPGGFGAGLGGIPGMGPGMGPGGGMAPPIAGPGMSPMGPGAMGPGPMGPGAMGPGGGTRP
ncbi:MAG: hypothetical protein A3I66_23365 [Burkholderiales bacterium RIFCSPLOWO2_02_FULL_57_36]|nr:MAG: hypothetical protein A3I66_23365 [Burkholderiales bacterium RIFCSPLOWO2_02_FULL_57_36]